jgi:hypothetical protein
LIDNNTNKQKEKEKKNMIHNTYDAITTSGKKEKKHHKHKFTGIDERKKDTWVFLIIIIII